MSKPFATALYQSKSWEQTRGSVYNREHGLCQLCGGPGLIVHHVLWLTPNNINDSTVTLSQSNLVLVCLHCHNLIHMNAESLEQGLKFDEYGDIVRTESNTKSKLLHDIGRTYDLDYKKLLQKLREADDYDDTCIHS